MFTLEPVYLLLIIPTLLTWLAQARVRKVYKKFESVPNQGNMTGREAARRLLDYYGLSNVRVEQIKGTLSDHYDPQTKTLRLSEKVASSVTALGIVAHEVGHAVQDAEGYRFMRLRMKMAGVLGQLAWVSPLVFVGGMIYGIASLMILGGVLLAGQAVFSLVTLPVERDASDRALKSLEQTGLAVIEENKGLRKVLRSAAFTYLTQLGKQTTTFLFFITVIGTTHGVWSG